MKLYIDFKLAEIKTIKDLATRFHTSSNTLRKTFLRSEKVPLSDYIRQRKVEAMKELLLVGNDHYYSFA